MMSMIGIYLLAGIVLISFFAIGFLYLGKNPFGRPKELSQNEWPVLAKTGDRNQAYMIKALLDDANVEAIVEEDTTLGILYGAQSITDYPIRVPDRKLNLARGILKESSFSDSLVSSNES